MTTPQASSHLNILLFATGSVATIKLPLLVTAFLQHPVNLQVVLSPSAERFLSAADLLSISSVAKIHRNEDEWAHPWSRGDPVLHIELRKWADIMVIAPLSANSLAAMAAGLCPGLGLSIVRAWDTTAYRGAAGSDVGNVIGGHPGDQSRKLILVAPAMNTQMYVHPLTEQHLSVLRSWGWVRILKPVEKLLACGDIGVGGMMEVPEIVREVVTELGLGFTDSEHD